MEEKNITPEESLSIIQQMISNSRERFANDGFSFLLWGILVIIGCLITHFAITFKTYYIINPTWIILILLGVAWTVITIMRRDKKNKYRSQIDFAGQMLWLAFLVSYGIVVYVLDFKENFNIYPIILVLLGLATFVSGGLMQFAPLYIGGIIFWAGAIGTPFIPWQIASLYFAALMFLGYIIPGLMLRWKVRNEKKKELL